ncbi:MAG TPA: DUF4331 domain-containing protein [Pseudomonas sabulinigri]|uniref:DUF4331 domain-containing protein n=1 Tax=marine sediment metagenome TaxID=412755 RepID=A0A0F9RSG2_9ZZZZ|nr:DUF4331 domain-containing protein [Halopseudomonas sabulinigri]HEC52617.1 DUF4331 domain-containing protein [Halopseudomonas sabulinigri]
MNRLFQRSLISTAVLGVCLGSAVSFASSHREAPFITKAPKVDGTDFYMFRSYEIGRENTVTLIANYLPLQDAYGGPNYFDLDQDAIYEIHIDNSGNAQEDITFQFKFTDVEQDLQLAVGDSGATEQVSVPLKNIGGIGPGPGDTGSVQMTQTYEVSVIRGDRRTGTAEKMMNTLDGSNTFIKPVDNIGGKSFSDYQGYAEEHIYAGAFSGCNGDVRVFAGQRQEAFAVNLGEIFDLVNTNPLGPRNAETNDLADKNVTSLALEVPISCLTGVAANSAGQPVLGGWTTASLRQGRVLNPQPMADGTGASVSGGAYTQVSRLGMPLVNEVVIGLKDKDAFNASQPMDDGQFATYVTNPTLPELLEILFAGTAVAPNMFPRTDLVTAFLEGVPGVNMPVGVTGSEMLRLNPAIEVTAFGMQNDLGVLGGDNAGFPNGRRPIDDVVDASLRVAMGALISDATVAPNNTAPFTDGVQVDPANLMVSFPYLNTPLPGAPN